MGNKCLYGFPLQLSYISLTVKEEMLLGPALKQIAFFIPNVMNYYCYILRIKPNSNLIKLHQL